MILIQTETLR